MTSQGLKDFGKVSIIPPNVRELRTLIEHVLSKDVVKRNLEKLLRHPSFTNEFFSKKYEDKNRKWIAQFLIFREKFTDEYKKDVTTRIKWFQWIMKILKEEKIKYDLNEKYAKIFEMPTAPTNDPGKLPISDTLCYYYFIIFHTIRKIIEELKSLKKIDDAKFNDLFLSSGELDTNIKNCEIRLGHLSADPGSFDFNNLDRDLTLLKTKLMGLGGIDINKEFLKFFDTNEGEDKEVKEAKKQALIGLVTRFRDKEENMYEFVEADNSSIVSVEGIDINTDYEGNDDLESDFNIPGIELDNFVDPESGNVGTGDVPVDPESSIVVPPVDPERGNGGSGVLVYDNGPGGGTGPGGGFRPGGGTIRGYTQVNKTRPRNPGFWGPEDLSLAGGNY